MASEIEFADEAALSQLESSAQFQQVKNLAHEHLLARIEELGAEFGRWSTAAINQFVTLEIDSFVRLHRIPMNESEIRHIAQALTRELNGFGPLQEVLDDPAVEDILVNGYQNVYVSRRGILERVHLLSLIHI